jgi:DNA-binding response OmpR family regulator
MDGDIEPPLRSPMGTRAHAFPVLVVEDDPLIAEHARAILETAGFIVTGIATTLAEARSLRDATLPKLALVDLNLSDGRTGGAVACALTEAGCAVVMATGQPADVPPGTPAHAVLCKPYQPRALIRALFAAACATPTA